MYKFPNLYKMQTLPLSEFRAQVSAMIDLVEKGETVRILRHGKPVAELVPPQMAASASPKLPSWKIPFEPVKTHRPDGKTGAQLIVDEREGGW
jgi:prevent-host-death family protein